jgi:endogenous inhibitor of DNA gyrase (YacG/DUF329 family)
MAQIIITCKNCQKPISTGMAMDEQSFKTATLTQNKVTCPHCQTLNVWDKKDARLADAASS